MMNKYQNLSKEDLLKLVAKQEAELAAKKYGLVWDSEREPEQVVLDCESNLPVLKRVKGKEIKTCDEADNILIEGDNYHALTVLNYTHKEKIDVIYIDPPYNTGNKDFIYNDRYVDKEDGYRHSKWLNFMEKRLNLAKRLLKETGVIFISIDDNEASQLKLLCDSVFGEENFVANIIWQKKFSRSNDATYFSTMHDYILCYARRNILNNNAGFRINLLSRKDKIPAGYSNPDNDPRGLWTSVILSAKSGTEKLIYEIKSPGGKSHLPPSGRFWTYNKEKVAGLIKENRIWFGRNGNGTPRLKTFLSEVQEGLTPNTIWFHEEVGNNQEARQELKEIFSGQGTFDNPKPVRLIKRILELGSNKNSVILDFMAGSGTTGQAVLDLNKEDEGKRKFILCTNNELNGLADELRKKGMDEKEIQEHGICRRVTYPRIKKVINGYENIKGEKISGLGGNLQYFRTDLIKKTKSKDQVRVDLTQRCTQMLCVKENIFNLDVEKEDYKIFSSHKKDKFLCVYYNFLDESFEEFLREIKKLKGKKIIYMFSMDGTVDANLFKGVDNFDIEEIPQKILEIYKQLVKMNIPVKADTIFLDLEKAKSKIFEDKEKDEGARILRIVLEKTIQKIAQRSGMNILKENAKEEKTAILNDRLKSENVFSKVQWEENKTYLAIGNHASHGEYSEYELKHAENFYKHAQTLIESFNI
jgi:adenine-specific DNA-methyltransferase